VKKSIFKKLILPVFTIIIAIIVNSLIFTNALDWPPTEYRKLNSLNLSQGEPWNIYLFDGPPICQNKFCGPLEAKKKIDHRSPVPFNQFESFGGSTSAVVQYEKKFNISNLEKFPEAMAVHYLRVHSGRSEFYLNGVQVGYRTGTRSSNIEFARNILRSGENTMVIRIWSGTYSAPGIDFEGNVLITSLQTANNISKKNLRRDTVMKHFLTTPRWLLILLFSVGIIFYNRYSENTIFLGYLLATAVQFTLMSGMLGTFVKVDHWIASKVFEALSHVILLGFALSFFRVKGMNLKKYWQFSIGAILVCALYVNINDVKSIDLVKFLDNVSKIFLICSVITAISLGAYSIHVLRKIERARSRLLITSTMTSAFVAIGFYLPSYLAATKFTWNHSLMSLFFAVLCSLIIIVDSVMVRGKRDILEKIISKLVDPKLVNTLEAQHDKAVLKRQEVVAMFSDIRSFSKLSGIYPPHDVVEMINGFMNYTNREIDKYGGVVDKYAGDQVMALWGVPDTSESDYFNSVKAAIHLRKALTDFNSDREENGKFPISVGMGLHCGDSIVGEIGSDRRANFTAIGPTINIAARIESACPALSTDILISEDLYLRVKNDVAVCDEGVIPFKGIDKDVKLFRLIGYYNEQGNLITHDKGYEKISFTRGSVYCGTPLAGNLVNIFYDSEDSKDVNVDSKISKNVA
jgi:class 3 adenylate cyclase